MFTSGRVLKAASNEYAECSRAMIHYRELKMPNFTRKTLCLVTTLIKACIHAIFGFHESEKQCITQKIQRLTQKFYPSRDHYSWIQNLLYIEACYPYPNNRPKNINIGCFPFSWVYANLLKAMQIHRALLTLLKMPVNSCYDFVNYYENHV